MLSSLKDKVAIITGASAGIGFATALNLANQGASLILNARNRDKLSEAIAGVIETPCALVDGDITHSDVQDSVVQTAVDSFGKIDILVNNVGGGHSTFDVEEISNEDWDDVMNRNLKASFQLCREVVPLMKTHSYGRIINVSSFAGRFRGRLSGPSYSAAKAGLQGLTRHLAWELGKYGITVNAVAPGFTETTRAKKKWESLSPKLKKQFMDEIPVGRFGRPDEMAAAITFLASNEASYITGVTLDVNGGSYMV